MPNIAKRRPLLTPDPVALPRIGTAGWSIPAGVRAAFPAAGTHLERYAQRLGCVEINSAFYRPHRRATYERWAQSVPAAFRFAVKVPREITHERRLVEAGEPLARFLDESAGLGVKRAILLVQLPPSFAFDAETIARFFAMFRGRYAERIVCEPRHASWFAPAAERVLEAFDVTRVRADPPPCAAAAATAEPAGFAYLRWHGAPRIYYSPYPQERILTLAQTLRSNPSAWCIFDNTAAGAAAGDALALQDECRVAGGHVPSFAKGHREDARKQT